jgi:aarF domain-containing kinase
MRASGGLATLARTGAAPWVCRTCKAQGLRSVPRTARPGRRQYSSQAGPKQFRGLSAKTIIWTSILGSAAATAVVYPDDVAHAYNGAKRSGRVVGGLAKCINEYVF